MTSPFPTMTLPEIVGEAGLLTDGDWVESKDQDESGTIRLLQLADVGDGAFLDRSDRWLNEEQAARLRVTYLAPGDVLVARMPDPLGRACVCPALPTRAITVVDVCVVRAPAHNARWIMHALNAPQTRSRVAGLQSGSTRKRISKGNLSTILLPVPPRDTQDRLVAAIDTQLSRLDASVASLARAKANVANARASVLKAAVEGRLVPTEEEVSRAEGRKYEPAAALLARARSAVDDRAPVVESTTHDDRDLPSGWAWAAVGDLFDHRLGKMLDGAKNTGPLRPYLRNANVRWFSFDLGDLKHMRVPDGELADVSVRLGDIVVCEGGEPGRAAVWTAPGGDFVIQKACHRLRPRTVVAPQYFAYVLAVDAHSGRLAREFTGSTIKHLTGQRLRPHRIPVPPLAEQRRIVAEVERRVSVLGALERSIDVSLARCGRLRQAILKRAFDGRLSLQVPLEPEAAPSPAGEKEPAR